MTTFTTEDREALEKGLEFFASIKQSSPPHIVDSGASVMPANTITFNILGEAVLNLDKDGFTYLGERITDAGKAYDIWMEVMLKMKAQEK